MGEITLKQVRKALSNIYYPSTLAETELAQILSRHLITNADSKRGQLLRRLLLDTIEQLRPSAEENLPSASQYRAYRCITLRYLSSMSIDDIAHELSLSLRQVYRDLRWSELRFTEILNELYAQESNETIEDNDCLIAELSALTAKKDIVKIDEIIASAIPVLTPLMNRYKVNLAYCKPESSIAVQGNHGVLRETVIQIISAAIQAAYANVSLALLTGENNVILAITLAGETRPKQDDLIKAALHVANAQGYSSVFDKSPSKQIISLQMPLARQKRVLIVEDNASAYTLYERFLAMSEWEPIHVINNDLVCELCISKQAMAVILDIMLPDTDGWSLLQALKLNPLCKKVPVIICSVINDPELGQALGASFYLAKPINRAVLLQALSTVSAVNS